MTISEVARLEGISDRQAQRYCREGFKGIVLKAVRLGKSLHIIPDDYKLWREQCGFDATPPESGVVPPASSTNLVEHPASAPPDGAHPAFRPWPLCADPNGVPTNVPDPHSCTMPHPEACRIHDEELRQRMYGGSNDDDL